MDTGSTKKRKENPRESANILSVISFFYTLPIILQGRRKDLEEQDIYKVLKRHDSKKLGDMLESEWKLEVKLKNNPSIFRALLKCFGKRYFCLGLTQLAIGTANLVAGPYALSRVVHYFKADQTDMSRNEALLYGAMMVGLNLVMAIYHQNLMLELFDVALRIKISLCSLMYRKSLSLSSTVAEDFSMGNIVTMMTKDTNIFQHGLMFLHHLWIGVIHFLVLSILIYLKMGLSTLVLIGFFFIVIPAILFIGIKTTKLRISTAEKTDKRLQATQEVLSAIKVIKMHTWEKYFTGLISDARRKEIGVLLNIYVLRVISFWLGSVYNQICFFVMILIHTSRGNALSADTVYYVTACLHNLHFTINIAIPIGILFTSEMISSFKRIGNFLTFRELLPVEQCDDKISHPRVTFSNYTVKIFNNEVIRNISLNIENGLTILTGNIGSGKSTLLKAVLQEYNTSGKMNVVGKFSYASQDPWLFPGTIRQNIIFGEKFNAKRYETVLTVCALKYDIEIFTNNDETIVEDKGINLSKGQQARINLARAVYRDCDIYLLDDCLASLDTNVQKFIFKECIQGFLRNKLVIMVTQNSAQMSNADRVLILDQGVVKKDFKPQDENEENLKDLSLDNERYLDDRNSEMRNNELNIQKNADLTDISLDKNNDETKLHDNLYHEDKQSGGVSLNVYKNYVRFAGGFIILFLLILVFAANQAAKSGSDKILSRWVNIQENISNACDPKNITNATLCDKYEETNSVTRQWFGITVAATAALTFLKTSLLFCYCCRASVRIHRTMIRNVIGATMEFFDTHFVGNILNRFSKDLASIDEHFPQVLHEVIRVFCHVLGSYILIMSVNTIFILPSIICFLVLLGIRFLYLPTGRSLNRLDAATRSPIVGHVNATLEGLPTIRATGVQDKLTDEFDKHQDLFSSAFYMGLMTQRGFAVGLELVCIAFVAVVVFTFLLFEIGLEPGTVGLALTQAVVVTGIMQWGIRQWAELETSMTSVERVLEYTDVKTEDPNGVKKENWPGEGNIKYDHVSLTYNKTNETVLKDICFDVKRSEKIGVVGRTGAGKSSIISTLFRLYDVEGAIQVDNTDIKILSLEFLRSSMTLIPQDPILFTGTIRSNIDPYNKYPDQKIWDALETVHLKQIVSSLADLITDGGSNFSSGQKQLMCLARALVKNCKIVILDEATANMDNETDTVLHSTIRNRFKDSTVITIAHRLHAVRNADRVMVLDQGKIVEYDEPNKLLEDKHSSFYKLVKQSDLA